MSDDHNWETKDEHPSSNHLPPEIAVVQDTANTILDTFRDISELITELNPNQVNLLADALAAAMNVKDCCDTHNRARDLCVMLSAHIKSGGFRYLSVMRIGDLEFTSDDPEEPPN